MMSRFGWRRHHTSFAVLLVVGLFLFSVVLFVRTYVVQVIRVEGISMEPAYTHGDFAWVNRLSYVAGHPRRGDVVLFRHPETGALYMKRVVAVSGDVIDVVRAELVTTGTRSHEADIVQLKDEQYFVLGDNREHSTDSRDFGILNQYDIVGKVQGSFSMQ